MSIPEPCFPENTREDCFRAVKGAIEAPEKPVEPLRDVQTAFLRRLQNVVIIASLLPDLRGHAVEALRGLLRARQRHVGNRPSDPAVAILEGMDGDKPEMRDRRLENR